jgi:hypothetical protein
VARKLSWKGRLLNKTGHLTLINSVISSLLIYHMTVFLISKWAIQKIDKITRKFLWRGADHMRKGNCMVHWKRVQRSKQLGGLGIHDSIGHFASDGNGSNGTTMTVNMPVAPSQTESELFKTCATINIGNWRSTKFWMDKWLHGHSPDELAPALFSLAWRKQLTVAQALSQGKWMRGAQRISTTEEVMQFVHLWQLISNTRPCALKKRHRITG